MPSMDIVFTQIIVILLYVLIGFAAGKSGLINPDERKFLTGICTNLILPFTVLSASNQDLTRQELAGLGMNAAAILLLFALLTAVSLGVHKMLGTPLPARVTMTSLVVYPNCTFLGLPLCLALFGDTAILNNVLMMVAFNILFFTWQYNLFTSGKFRIRNLITPPTIATGLLIVMLACKLRLPAPLMTVTSNTGGMISPLSLIIVGVMMSENRLTAIFAEKRAYLVILFRNLLIPLALIPVLKLLPLAADDRLCLLIYMACPCATLTSIYAIRTDMEPELAAHGVLLSTICFAFTLPLMIMAGNAFLM